MKKMIVFFALCTYSLKTLCHIKSITKRLEVGEYACITHPCAMPGDAAQYVQEFHDVYILGEGRIITPAGALVSLGYTYDHTPIIPADIIFKEQDGTVAIFSALFQHSWYHWLIELLPRLYVLQKSGLDYDYIYVYSAAHAYMASIQMQSLCAVLDYLGIPRNKVLLVDEGVCLHAKKVLRPSFPYLFNSFETITSTCPLWVRDFLQDVFLPSNNYKQEKGGYNPCIYVSRSDAGKRLIANEATLMGMLAGYGFKMIVLSEYEPHQQAAIFNQASVIIAQHGGGLTNVVFCKPGTKILELDLKRIKKRVHFELLSGFFGLEFRKFEVGVITQNWNDLQHDNDDIVVDVDEFEKCLKEFLKN